MANARKLSDEAVREIKASSETAKVLAQRYGVSVPTIYQTKNGTRNQNREHPLKLGRPRKPRATCHCGCGAQVAKIGSVYRPGHHPRSSQTAEHSVLASTYRNCIERDLGHRVDGQLSPCWIWQGARLQNGYARIYTPGNSTTTRHRAVYAVLHPSEDLTGRHVHHVCGQGHQGCVNPTHLLSMRTVDHGRAHHAKITEADVEEIRAPSQGPRSRADEGESHDHRAGGQDRSLDRPVTG